MHLDEHFSLMPFQTAVRNMTSEEKQNPDDNRFASSTVWFRGYDRQIIREALKSKSNCVFSPNCVSATTGNKMEHTTSDLLVMNAD